MRKKLIISMLGMSICQAANAAQIKEVLPDGEVQAFISAVELSRIKVIGGRIRSVRSNEGELDIVEDGVMGEIYITPARSTKQPINLFVTTERNNTYKLLLIPRHAPSEQVFIKSIEGEYQADGNKNIKSESFKARVAGLIRSMELQQKIAGFKRSESQEKILFGEEELTAATVYRGPNIAGYVLEVDGDYELTEGAYESSGLIAISLDEPEIAGQRYLYVVKEATDGI